MCLLKIPNRPVGGTRFFRDFGLSASGFGQKRPGAEASLFRFCNYLPLFLRRKRGRSVRSFPAEAAAASASAWRNFRSASAFASASRCAACSLSRVIRSFQYVVLLFLLPFSSFPSGILPSASVPHPPVLPPTSGVLPLASARLPPVLPLLPPRFRFYFSCFRLCFRYLPLGFRLCFAASPLRSRRLPALRVSVSAWMRAS